MIGHCLDPNADHDPYARCTSIADIERVLASLPPRAPLSWAEGVTLVERYRDRVSPLAEHPRLCAMAEDKRRSGDLDLLAALERLAAHEQHPR